MNQLALIPPSIKLPSIYLYNEPVTMCYGFPRLLDIVESYWKTKELKNGSLYVFVNRTQTYCKILFWSNGGLCILAKRLEKGRFEFNLEDKVLTITSLNKKLTVK
jgi:hypothetical protein